MTKTVAHSITDNATAAVIGEMRWRRDVVISDLEDDSWRGLFVPALPTLNRSAPAPDKSADRMKISVNSGFWTRPICP
ncbi:hypothetical protein [Devosia limi]|uniref:hypothetical protein n=1 Tax=Devosia limi TaxID=288995 RepID=UPI0015B5A63C|nr:hypothetical protein [Devosia limi]